MLYGLLDWCMQPVTWGIPKSLSNVNPQVLSCALQSQPDAIKAELESVFNKEEEGRVPNQTLRLKKVALERAYEAALKKKKASRVTL